MKILVCGGAGYIGSHTVKKLLREGFEVAIFDNFSSGRRELLTGGEVIAADINDREALRKVFRQGDVAAVFHFASLIQVGESYLQPHKYYSHNLMTSLNLLGAMLEAGAKRLIFSSSAAVYGIPEETPIPESHPLNPFNPYGRTKLFTEQMLRDYDRAYGLKFISLRYFNAAGADPEGELGEMHDPETHLIPNILLYLLKKKPAFELYGTDFPTPDGTAIRDYIHVTDLASAHVLALRRLMETGESDVLNLGANRGHSVLEVIRTVEAVTGRSVPYQARPRRTGDVPVLLASRQKAERELGWVPSLSDIETIIETAWKWHQTAPEASPKK
jgi:UDP-glucose-4-epimerase GalE